MRTKISLYCCAGILALGFATAGAQPPPLQEPALTGPERQELRELVTRFDPDIRDPSNLPLFEQWWLLVQLRDLAAMSLLAVDTERLTVCSTIGDPHLEIGDVIVLTKLPTGTVRMQVVRNEGAANETHPWTNADNGGNTVILNAAITGRPRTGSTFKRFTPEAVGRSRVGTHPGGMPTDHDFSIQRITRTPSGLCTDPEPLRITVPEQHPTGNRHGGHAVLN